MESLNEVKVRVEHTLEELEAESRKMKATVLYTNVVAFGAGVVVGSQLMIVLDVVVRMLVKRIAT